MYTLGVDIGSTASKAAILENGNEIIKTALVPVGAGTSGPARVLKELFAGLKIDENDMAMTVVTGYGRFNFKQADKQISELSCHAKGVHHLLPRARTIIDIGGQDAKALKLDESGRLLNFVMNDKCAAGTGRFLDVMASVLEADIDELGKLSDQAQAIVDISSTCTVFAESEVISQLANGKSRPDIVAGINKSIAKRVGGLALRVGLEKDVVMTGGVARNRGVVNMMEMVLNTDIQVTDYPQFTGAIGAAIYAYEEIKSKEAVL
nr:acyl-CoA dehydratase activase [uncultured Bacillus sp.]